MAKISKTEKQEIKKTLSKWGEEGKLLRMAKSLFVPAGATGLGLAIFDVVSTGGLGTIAYVSFGICGVLGGGGLCADFGVIIEYTEPTGHRVKSKSKAARALWAMQSQARKTFNEMSQKPKSEHAPYLKQLQEIEHDAKVLKPLYQVFNKAGEEQDCFEFILQEEKVEAVIVKKETQKQITVADMNALDQKSVRTLVKKVHKLGK